MPLHGTFPHRITSNLHSHQYARLAEAARCHGMRPAPFLRDAALAYLDQRFLLPQAIEQQLEAMLQETRRVGTNINQLAAKANTLQRVTLGDLRQAKRLTACFEEHVRLLQITLSNLSPDR